MNCPVHTIPILADRKGHASGLVVSYEPCGPSSANATDAKAAGDHQGHPPLLSCPSWARTRTLLIPYHFGLRRRLQRSWSGLCLHLRHHAVRWLPLQSLHLPRSGLGSALPVRVRRLREHAHTTFPTWCPAYCQSQACCQLHQGAVFFWFPPLK